MITVFALLDTYDDAKRLVDELIGAGVDVADMNAMVQSRVAKTAMGDHVDFSRMGVDVTDEVGEKRYHGLDALIVGEQAVNLAGVGDVFAAGELATMMATTATQSRDDVGTALSDVFEEFNLNHDAAETYYEGIDGGGWLIFVKTEDDVAHDARPVMLKHSDDVTYVND